MPSKLTNEEFIIKANIIHNNKFLYDKCNYINSKHKVLITCKEHGDFEQLPSNHLFGQACPLCGGSKKMSTENFIKKSVEIHGNKYLYEKTNYINNKTKVIITCLEHGDFEQQPGNHLSNHGCPSCKKKAVSSKLIKTCEQFIIDANKKHDNIYDYNKVIYTGCNNKVIITCREHGDFEQSPDSHIRGSGCPKCASSGFNVNCNGFFYIQELTNENMCIGYKFGITKNIKQRISIQKSKSKLSHKLIFKFESNGKNILEIENYIKQNINSGYLDKTIFPDGFTETISPDDILKLENIVIDFLLGDKHE